jgi:hypothetical protein
MAVTKVSQDTDITPLEESAKIQFICPVCKSEKILDFPKSVITNAKGLTTMSIANGLVCEHQFQAFVDKNCMVRGYQRVDFEFETTKPKEKVSDSNRNEEDLFDNLILEGNYLEYKPKHRNETPTRTKDKNKELKEIYSEFWEFIDDDNKLFQVFIKKDMRRKNLLA